MKLNDILSETAQRLGLKDTRIETLKHKRDELITAIRNNHDRLDALKEKIAELDAQLARKKKEYDAAGPGIKRIVKRELGILFEKLDRVSEPVAAIADRIRQDELMKDKLDLLIFAEENPTQTETIDWLTDDVQDFVADSKQQDVALSGLEKTRYDSAEKDATLDARIDALDSTAREPVAKKNDALDERIAQLN